MTTEDRISTTGLVAQLASFNRTFWIANAIEMFERFAYYGLRTVVPIYMVLSVEEGGPQFDHLQKGFIFAWWAAIQTLVPVFTGGYADRYGYKLTVGISIAIKVAGYLVMGFALPLAALLSGGASVGSPGHPVTLAVFCAGAWLLALGTAVFKPGIQGIMAHQLDKDNESTGWAVFYQLVNVGGFLGPFLAGVLRLLDWTWVFVACAALVSVNYLLLLTFPEPPSKQGAFTAGPLGALKLLWDSAIGICEPRLMSFLVVFSGFWYMFNQLFDMLPNFIDQWVDSRPVLSAITAVIPFTPPEAWGGNLPQEYMINLNAGLIMLSSFAVGWVTGKLRSMTAMLVGIVLSTVAIASIGVTSSGWLVLAAIALFSVGEMWASPTKIRYFAAIAPPEKKGLYLGYINATNGFGWYIGSLAGGELYQEKGDIFVLARRHLETVLGMDAQAVKDLPQTEVMPTLAARLGTDVDAARTVLWTTYEPQQIWPFFASIGLVSLLGLLAFDQVTRRKLAAEPWLLTALTLAVATYSYGWRYGVLFTAPLLVYLVLERVAPQVLPQGDSRRSKG